MSIKKELFGKTPQGDAYLYTITSKRLEAVVSNYGAVLVRLCTPDRDGNMKDIVLGFDTLKGYMENPYCYGASIGPCTNRTAGASFEIDGEKYSIPANEGKNNLHSDKLFYKRLFDATVGDDSVTFTLSLPDGDAGFPGNRSFRITYTLTDEDLIIDYHAQSDKKTVINLTNHSYFNLAGQDSGEVLDQCLTLNCSSYTPVDSENIPTGEIADVTGTIFDFREGKPIGRDLARSDDEAAQGRPEGYDHNFVIDGYQDDGKLREAAEVWDPATGRVMKVLTTLPGIQLYTSADMVVGGGKGGRTYSHSTGYALETQYYPDSIHNDNFPDVVFGEGRDYESTTVFRFGACR